MNELEGKLKNIRQKSKEIEKYLETNAEIFKNKFKELGKILYDLDHRSIETGFGWTNIQLNWHGEVEWKYVLGFRHELTNEDLIKEGNKLYTKFYQIIVKFVNKEYKKLGLESPEIFKYCSHCGSAN